MIFLNPSILRGFKKGGNSSNFYMSPQKWIKKTNAIGIISKSGRFGGTYAHKDIALELAMWISPQFKVYLLKDYDRLKNRENNEYALEWKVKRIITTTNYTLHTDAIKNNIIINKVANVNNNSCFEYVIEADILNKIVWNTTAKQWRMANPELAVNGRNIRDYGSINELTILSNLETLNAELIGKGIYRNNRIQILTNSAQKQFESFKNIDHLKDLKKIKEFN